MTSKRLRKNAGLATGGVFPQPARQRLAWAALAVAVTFAAIGAFGLPLLSSWNERVLESSFDLYLERHALQTTVMSFVMLALGLGIAIPVGIGLSQSGRWASPQAAARLLALLTLGAIVVLANLVFDPIDLAIQQNPENAENVRRLLASGEPYEEGMRALLFLVPLLLGIERLLARRAQPAAVPGTPRDGELRAGDRRLLLLVGSATFFQGYDGFILVLALPAIGTDLGVGEGPLALALAVVRGGALLAIAGGAAADRLGRRKVLLWSLVGYTLATGATAFSETLIQFAVCQFIASIFLTAEVIAARVLISEELPRQSRGHGLGLLGAFAALGAGLAALLFPTFASSEWGWRGMYAVGLAPLLLVGILRTRLGEGARWLAGQTRRIAGSGFGLRDLWREPTFRQRGILLMALGVAGAAAQGPVSAFLSQRTTVGLDWSPSEVSLLVFGGGAIGFIANFIVGRISDRIGRRSVFLAGSILVGVGAWLFYRTGASYPGFALLAFGDVCLAISWIALLTESFPVDLRATAGSAAGAAGVIGAMLGLFGVGALVDVGFSSAAVISTFALAGIAIAPAIFLVAETRGVDFAALDEQPASFLHEASATRMAGEKLFSEASQKCRRIERRVAEIRSGPADAEPHAWTPRRLPLSYRFKPRSTRTITSRT